jgi:Putative DNA-binding domain
VTIFGAGWGDLTLDHVQTFLEQADDEPLLWEAKGTKLDKSEIRRQICAFANSHEGGYLILGAERVSTGSERSWRLDGVAFPDEPMTWITQIVGDPERGVRPLPRFDVAAWPTASGHVSVVRVDPISTPPCIANGTVYERLPGVTQTVRDPLRLAELFSRGDEARRDAQTRADRAAETVMIDALEGDAGVFVRPNLPAIAEAGDPEDQADSVRLSVGVAATGNVPHVAARLFRHEFAEDIWTQLRDRPLGLPAGFGWPPDPVVWSQDALTWRHQVGGPVASITVVRAAWDGSAAMGYKLDPDEGVYPDSLAEHRIGPQWRLSEELVERLGGFGDVYVTVIVAGGKFARRVGTGSIVMRRGPLVFGAEDAHIASLGRELMRAVGQPDPEP